MKLRNYTLRYLVIALLAVIALWAILFYMVIIEEVYDNIDDGLKNSKIQIIRETKSNKELLNTPEFGIHQFKIMPLPAGIAYDTKDRFVSTFEYMEYDEDNEPIRLLQTVFTDTKGHPHRLTIRASMVEEDELMEDLMTALIALYIMLVISIALINHFILGKAWKPFYGMLDSLRLFRIGAGTTFKAPQSPVDEFKVLGKELEQMLERNEAIYASQKQFIENASHELQTPLAISLNKLELFAENTTLPEEQMKEISKISDTLNRLVRLNKSLLMLSKIENRQFADEESVDFNKLTVQLAEDFSDLAEYKDITVTVTNKSALHYSMNRGLALTLLTNLVKNAIIHTGRGGSVTIMVSGQEISVANTADGPGLDNQAIFTRFYRGSQNEQSTGLGLSIVQSISDTYGLHIAYSFTSSHVFTITFPQKE
jgi:signal transduction histidine kinase